MGLLVLLPGDFFSRILLTAKLLLFVPRPLLLRVSSLLLALLPGAAKVLLEARCWLLLAAVPVALLLLLLRLRLWHMASRPVLAWLGAVGV
jgi:hypothetical protein